MAELVRVPVVSSLQFIKFIMRLEARKHSGERTKADLFHLTLHFKRNKRVVPLRRERKRETAGQREREKRRMIDR